MTFYVTKNAKRAILQGLTSFLLRTTFFAMQPRSSLSTQHGAVALLQRNSIRDRHFAAANFLRIFYRYLPITFVLLEVKNFRKHFCYLRRKLYTRSNFGVSTTYRSRDNFFTKAHLKPRNFPVSVPAKRTHLCLVTLRSLSNKRLTRNSIVSVCALNITTLSS